ncbi:hypothetical protein ACVR1G_07470 [Streptococcus dentasini]
MGEDELSDDTEVLSAEIEALNTTINTNNSLLEGMASDDPNRTTTENAVNSDTAERDKRQKKLDKINAYDAASSGFFSDIAGLEADVSSGLTLLNQGIAGFNGSFTMPSKKDLEWTKTINSQWDEREAYQAALEKIGNGEELSDKDKKAIEVYKKNHPNIKVDDAVETAKQQHENQKSLYEQFVGIMGSDEAKRLSQAMALLPKNFTKAVLKSDGFWEILAAVEKTGAKGDKFVTAVLNGLSKYESMGKFGEKISNGFNYLEKAASPLKSAAKWGLEKVTNIKTLENFVTKGLSKGEKLSGILGKAVKLGGKTGTVLTVAELGITGISSGIAEYQKTGDVGKAVGKGALSAVSSVGPLEGATLGAAVGGVPGAVIGAGIGAAIQGIKMIEPKFFDNPVKGTKDIANKAGKAISGAANAVSKGIGGIGKALGFG